jgi:hypothetical protein
MEHCNEQSGDIRVLSQNEIDAVTGGATISIGPINIGVAEGNMVFGIGIEGVGAVGLLSDGSVCGVTAGGRGGCTEGDPWAG